MKLDKLEDLFEIDHEKLKAAENKRVITKIKQILKSDNKSEARADKEAKDYPYDAIGMVGEKLVYLKFDLDTKEARVVNIEVDPRDNARRNIMGGAKALDLLDKIIRNQKEK